MRFAIIKANAIINIVMLENSNEATLEEGQSIQQTDTAQIGDLWDGTSFSQPPLPPPTWADHQVQAAIALGITDTVALRCFKAGVPFPTEWQTYVAALRVIVRATSGDPTASLPTAPAYPAGT